MKSTVGIIFGCFIPLHIGHLSLIYKAAKMNDKVIIAVCGSDNDRGKDFIPFRDRIKLVKKVFAGLDNIIVVAVDDEKLKLDGTFTLDNWRKWSEELFDNAGICAYDYQYEFTWYTGELSYVEKLKELFNFHNFFLASRRINDISGTEIRHCWERYSGKIDVDFWNYLVDKKLEKKEN
jgi:cytidyltransferase-like protein